jgi:tyrosyl-tRNA synthetase
MKFKQHINEISKMKLVKFLSDNKITSGFAEGRRLITMGGVHLNDKKIDDINFIISDIDVIDGSIKIRIGKKRNFKIDI